MLLKCHQVPIIKPPAPIPLPFSSHSAPIVIVKYGRIVESVNVRVDVWYQLAREDVALSGRCSIQEPVCRG